MKKSSPIPNHSLYERVSICLARPSHPGNIGSCARAMKTMGFEKLNIMSPLTEITEQAHDLASGASDILQHANIFSSIEKALFHSSITIGMTARKRTLAGGRVNDISSISTHIAEYLANNKNAHVTFLFGNERTGLLNQEIKYCQYNAHIPTSRNYESLNLAQAVQVACYELRKNIQETVDSNLSHNADEIATSGDVQYILNKIIRQLRQSGYFNYPQSRNIDLHLFKIFNKAQLTRSEARLINGMLNQLER